MKHSSTKSSTDLLYAASTILSVSLRFIKEPVGLFGLQMNIQSFFGRISRSFEMLLFRFIVFRKLIEAPCNFAAYSYSPNVGIGINTLHPFRNAAEKL